MKKYFTKKLHQQEEYYQIFYKQLHISEDTKVPKEGSNMFSSEHIQNKVLTITSEHPYSGVHFERKFQTNIFSSDQSFEKYKKNI